MKKGEEQKFPGGVKFCFFFGWGGRPHVFWRGGAKVFKRGNNFGGAFYLEKNFGCLGVLRGRGGFIFLGKKGPKKNKIFFPKKTQGEKTGKKKKMVLDGWGGKTFSGGMGGAHLGEKINFLEGKFFFFLAFTQWGG